jgi:hypothetical protein
MASSTLDLSQRILRISRSDDTQGYVLLQVFPSSANALDLDIAATEGENPYTGTGMFWLNHSLRDQFIYLAIVSFLLWTNF